MAFLRLYSTAIVLGIWAVAWYLGAQGAAVIGFGLACMCVAAVISERERSRRRRGAGRA